jgi:hypothetical protein
VHPAWLLRREQPAARVRVSKLRSAPVRPGGDGGGGGGSWQRRISSAGYAMSTRRDAVPLGARGAVAGGGVLRRWRRPAASGRASLDCVGVRVRRVARGVIDSAPLPLHARR